MALCLCCHARTAKMTRGPTKLLSEVLVFNGVALFPLVWKTTRTQWETSQSSWLCRFCKRTLRFYAFKLLLRFFFLYRSWLNYVFFFFANFNHAKPELFVLLLFITKTNATAVSAVLPGFTKYSRTFTCSPQNTLKAGRGSSRCLVQVGGRWVSIDVDDTPN